MHFAFDRIVIVRKKIVWIYPLNGHFVGIFFPTPQPYGTRNSRDHPSNVYCLQSNFDVS